MPSIGWTKVEQHPFSYANCPVNGVPHEAVFLVKAEQGEFTCFLSDVSSYYQALQDSSTTLSSPTRRQISLHT